MGKPRRSSDLAANAGRRVKSVSVVQLVEILRRVRRITALRGEVSCQMVVSHGNREAAPSHAVGWPRPMTKPTLEASCTKAVTGPKLHSRKIAGGA